MADEGRAGLMISSIDRVGGGDDGAGRALWWPKCHENGESAIGLGGMTDTVERKLDMFRHIWQRGDA